MSFDSDILCSRPALEKKMTKKKKPIHFITSSVLLCSSQAASWLRGNLLFEAKLCWGTSYTWEHPATLYGQGGGQENPLWSGELGMSIVKKFHAGTIG